MKEIFTENAPKPAGHYSQAVVQNGFIFVSGQLPIDPATGEKKNGSVEEETVQALRNVAAILEEAGSDMHHVVKTTVYVTNIELWERLNAVYAEFFGDHRPARAVVPTGELHYGFHVEIEAMATVDV